MASKGLRAISYQGTRNVEAGNKPSHTTKTLIGYTACYSALIIYYPGNCCFSQVWHSNKLLLYQYLKWFWKYLLIKVPINISIKQNAAIANRIGKVTILRLISIIHTPENTENQIMKVVFKYENFCEIRYIKNATKIPHTNQIIKYNGPLGCSILIFCV